jgi:hypothetical protein
MRMSEEMSFGQRQAYELPAIPVKSKLSRKVWKRPAAAGIARWRKYKSAGPDKLCGSSRRRAKSPRRAPNGQLSTRQAAAGS